MLLRPHLRGAPARNLHRTMVPESARIGFAILRQQNVPVLHRPCNTGAGWSGAEHEETGRAAACTQCGRTVELRGKKEGKGKEQENADRDASSYSLPVLSLLLSPRGP